MQAAQPQIVTPQSYSKTMLEGFGEEAAKYIEWLKAQESNVKILQYGYTLKQESFSEHVVSKSKEEVLEEVREEVRLKNDPLSAVVDGVDDPWDVCLIKLFWEVVQQSAQTNVQQMAKRNLFEDSGGVPRGLREEIEMGFREASRDASKINNLGQKLQKYGLFDDYQDRFFALIQAK